MKLVDSIRDWRLVNETISWRLKYLVYLYGSYLYDPIRDILKLRLRNNPKRRQVNHNGQAVHEMTAARRGHDHRQDSATDHISESDVGFPPQLHPVGRIYQIISNVTVVLMFLKIILQFLDKNEALPTTYYLRCYAPRFVTMTNLEEKFMPMLTIVICLNHFIWRGTIPSIGRKLRLDLVSFLLAKTCLVQERIDSGSERLRRIESAPGKISLDILDSSMYFRMGDDYELRPNRTMSSRIELVDAINFYFNSSIFIVSLIALASATIGGYTLIFDLNSIYSDCGPELTIPDALFIYRFSSSAFVSLVYLFDCMISLFLAGIFAYLFCIDLLIYWREVRIKMDETYLMAVAKAEEQQDDEIHRSAFRCRCSVDFCQPLKLELSLDQQNARSDNASQDRRLIELKYYLIDFFGQVRQADQLLTYVIPMIMGIWQSCNAVMAFCGLQLVSNTTDHLLVIRLFQAGGICIATGLCALILRLKRNTESAYPILCSILAHDTNPDKRQWLRLMSVYSQMPRYAFTYLHSGIFSQITFLKTISYTLTLTVLIETMRVS